MKVILCESPLQNLSNEIVSSLTGEGCQPDIRARGFWRDGQNAYFDVKVSNINSERYKSTAIKRSSSNMNDKKDGTIMIG